MKVPQPLCTPAPTPGCPQEEKVFPRVGLGPLPALYTWCLSRSELNYQFNWKVNYYN